MDSADSRVYVINAKTRNNLRLRYINPETGRWTHKSAETNDPEEAMKAAGVLEQQLRTGIAAKSQGRLPWAEFVKIVTDERIAALAERSQTIYSDILTSITKIIRPATLGHLTSQAVSRWQAHQRKAKTAEATIESRSSALRAMLNWAVAQGYLAACPTFAKIVRSRTGTKAKGRPITEPEFLEMLKKTPGAVGGEKYSAGWIRSLWGLWWSGLRLSEAIDLSWDEPGRPRADMSSPVPALRILGDREKGMEDRLLPLAPEFGKWLLETPEAERTGPVFHWPRQRKRVSKKDPDRVSMLWVSHTISDIGEAAKVVVNDSPVKYASAHDLRRSFGDRWSRRVTPPILMELMRHEDIKTTMEFYREHNSRRTGEDLWQQFGSLGTTFGTTPEDKDLETR